MFEGSGGNPVKVGARVTSAEIVSISGDKPRLAITAENSDGTTGYFSMTDRSDEDKILLLDLEPIRGSVVMRSAWVGQDLLMEFLKKDSVSVVTFCDVRKES